MQSLVEQYITLRRYILPCGESASLHPIMEVASHSAPAGLAIDTEQILQLGKQVGIRSKMTEIVIAALNGFPQALLHFRPVVTMEAVAFHKGRPHTLAPEYLLERPADGSRAGAGGAGYGDDRVPG